MTIAQIKEILNGEFYDPSEREYWEQKLNEMEAKARRAENNKKYFDEMRKYDR